VLVCRQRSTGVVNLEKHLRQRHAVSLQQRRQIVQHFSELTLASPDAVELPEEPASLVEEPAGGGLQTLIKCACTEKKIASNRGLASKTYCICLLKLNVFQQWGVAKIFSCRLRYCEKWQRIGFRAGPSTATQQLSKVRKQIEDEIQVMEEAANTDEPARLSGQDGCRFPKDVILRIWAILPDCPPAAKRSYGQLLT
jgi:hypothetical protein